jgi:hypothetical protein
MGCADAAAPARVAGAEAAGALAWRSLMLFSGVPEFVAAESFAARSCTVVAGRGCAGAETPGRVDAVCANAAGAISRAPTLARRRVLVIR